MYLPTVDAPPNNNSERTKPTHRGGDGSQTGCRSRETESDPSTARTGIPINRRTWLATLSTVAVAPAVAAEAVRAGENGYGTGEYGSGPYGDPVDDDEAEERFVVETRDASNVGIESATLNGKLTELEGLDEVIGYFEWGPSGSLSNRTDGKTLHSTGDFSDRVSGLEGDTEYEFRAVVESGDTYETGSTLSLTTEREEEDEEHDEGEEEEQDEEGEESAPDTVPEIQKLIAEDISNPRNPHVDASIEWQATIEDGELDAAELTVSDSDGVVLSWEYDLNGQTAERSEEERIQHGAGQRGSSVQYTVELIVHSNHGTTESEIITFESQ